MLNLFALFSGALGGAGLVVSGMTSTAKIQGWLDFFGNWNPTLGFVLAGALIPMVVAWRITAARTSAFLGERIPRHPNQRVETNLIAGSVIFGVGWGLAGLCPGPAIASVLFGGSSGVVFFVSMATGMAVAPTYKLRFEHWQQAKR